MTIEDYNKIYSYPVVKQMELTFSETGQQDIVLTNADICSEEMSLEESLCSDENLRFGACESSCFKVRVVNSGTFKGKALVVEQNMVVDDERYLVDADGNRIVTDDGKYIIVVPGTKDATIQYGKYKVYSDEPSNDRMWRDLTCYDAMYEILNADVASWYSALTFPMTIKNLRDSFFTYLGITQETVTLVNDSFQTEGGFIAEGSLSGKTIIEAICELNGCFGHINRSGNFEYITIPSSESITYRWYVDGTGKYEDYVTSAITGIIARAEASDVGTSVGTTDNVLIIENNPLIYGTEGTQALTTALTNLLGVVSQITYRPFNVDTYGNPMLPIGTSVTVNTKKYDPENGYTPFAVTSFVKSRTLNGIQGLTDSISATGKQQRDAEVNNIQSQIFRTKGKVHDLKITVDEMYSEIYDANTGIKSTIQQLSDEVLLKVNGSGRLVAVKLNVDPSSATSYATILADDINLDGMNITLNGSRGITITSPNFSVTAQGSLESKLGKIGGWNIDSTKLYSNTIELSPSNIKVTQSGGPTDTTRVLNMSNEGLNVSSSGYFTGTFMNLGAEYGSGSAVGDLKIRNFLYLANLYVGATTKYIKYAGDDIWKSDNWGSTGLSSLDTAMNYVLRSRVGIGSATINGYAFGYITTGSDDLIMLVPLSMMPSLASATVTSVTIKLRKSGGGYVVSDGAVLNATNGYTLSATISHMQNLLYIKASKSDAFGTNNNPCIGTIEATVSFS